MMLAEENKWDLESGIVRGIINVHGYIVGDGHSSILQHIVGKTMNPCGWSSNFLTTPMLEMYYKWNADNCQG
jgi:hypothetical protein